MVDVVKSGRGRKPDSPEVKAAKAAAKLEAKEMAKSVAPPLKAEKPPKAPKAAKAPKEPTIKSVEAPSATRVEDLNDEQHQALALQHVHKYEQGLAAKKKADADFKNACKAAKAELGSEALDVIKGIVAARTESGKAMLRATVGINVMVLRWEGVPVGHMDDMFPDADRTPIDEKTFNDGKRAGMAGEPGKVPSHVPTSLIGKWTSGFDIGHAARNATHLGGIKQKAEADTAPAKTEDEVAEEDAYAQGVAAFKRGDGGIVPTNLTDGEKTMWLEGFDSMAKLAGQKQDEAKGQTKQARLADCFSMGAAAKERGGSGAPPSEMTDAESLEFKRGFDSSTVKPIDWEAQGAAAFRAGEPCEIPDAVEVSGRGPWRHGWISAKVIDANHKVGGAQAAAHG